MRPNDNPPSTREKIQDVLDFLSSEGVFLGPNARYTKAEMIKWCESWIKIYDNLPLPAFLRPPQRTRVRRSRRGFTARAALVLQLLGAGLDQYRLDVGAYPDGGVGLEALQRNPNIANWNGSYLKKSVPKDPWGNPYRYRCCPGQFGEYDLWSEGADGAPGGDGENADVVSWDSATK